LPLAILALTSTFLLHSSLNEKSEQELSAKIQALQTLYHKVLNNFKSIHTTENFKLLKEEVINQDTGALSSILIKLRTNHSASFAVLLDSEKELVASSYENNTLILYPVEEAETGISQMFEYASKGNIALSSDILTKDTLKRYGFENKLVMKKENNQLNQNGILTQIAILPIVKQETKFQSDTNEDLQVYQLHTDTVITDAQDIRVLAYLIMGNYINSNEDLSVLLEDMSNEPVNIIQGDTIISTNTNIPFDISSLTTNKAEKILSKNSYRGEQYINNVWYRIASEPIVNFTGNTIGQIIVGHKEDIFRSLKYKNSLLILQIALIMAAGGLILAYLFTKNITKPISQMVEAVRSIETGNMDFTLEIPAEDELGELALSINEMSRTLEARKNEILRYNQILIDQKSKLESIFNYSADGIMTLDSDRRITAVNPVLIRWTGKKEEDIIGKYFYEVIQFEIDPLKAYKIRPDIHHIEELQSIIKFYPTAKVKDVDLEISYSTIELEKDTVIGYVLILRDITKRKETEELRENFIATLTHDLRVPLLAGVHTLEYLLNGSYGELEEKQKYITEQVISSNHDLLRMVNTLLDTYSYESGKQALVKREININKLINETINELKYMAEDKKHKIIFESDKPDYMIIADKQEIKRVIVNLLSNAIIHTPINGRIEFQVTSQGEYMHISIKDNGVGLSEKDKEMIFQRYVRGGKTLRKVGTGLGLYLSKHIVEAHGGKIWVESVIKEGSIFTFSLPLSKKEMETINNDQT
jgi:two-component system sensor histidine kinase VicK